MSSLALFRETLKAVEAKDLASVLSLFDDCATFYDPHYPTTLMQGKESIKKGLIWGFSSLKKFGFTIVRNSYSNNGQVAVEVNTSHLMFTGEPLNFPQVFIIETKNDLITRLYAYELYESHGMNGQLARHG